MGGRYTFDAFVNEDDEDFDDDDNDDVEGACRRKSMTAISLLRRNCESS